ncbi:hypothetical protein HPB50_025452 [Hyalomma asiaticum]|uniref:Uncharacterized protein n=1 Tax=Hyalomma asiaticum TaxID=266040 RepID=A0ACB7RP67_HYAAI|nr:hypothetical protein HPB50_025452 [Hyalomma asiaticum]
MLNMDTMRIGSTVESAVEPSAVEAPVATAPLDPESPSRLERSQGVLAEPSAKPLVHKKGTTLRSFFWGTGITGKEPRSKRKKELLLELADLQRENARLQSECDQLRLICSELKQERLIELEEASTAKAPDRRPQSETQFVSSASQTDPCSNLRGDFRAVPRKNYAFIYNVFTVPTPEQLKRSLEKFQKSSAKVGFKKSSKSDARKDDSLSEALERDINPEVRVETDKGAESAEKTIQEVVTEKADEDPVKEDEEQKADARSESPVNEEAGEVVAQTEAPDVRSPDSPNEHEPNANKSSTRPSSCKTDRSSSPVVAEDEAAAPALPAQTQSAVENPTVEQKEPEVPAEVEGQPMTSDVIAKASAIEDLNAPPPQGFLEEESPAPDDKNTAVPDDAVLLSRSSSASKMSDREDRPDAGSPHEAAPVVIASPLDEKVSEKSSEKSSESWLLLKLRQAISNVAVTLDTGVNDPSPSLEKQNAMKSARETPAETEIKVEFEQGAKERYGTGTEPMASRHFLPPSRTDGGVQRDPGRKEFEKRRRVSCGTLKPPFQKAVVMNATVRCYHMDSPASPPASGASSRQGGASTPSSAATTPRPWGRNRIRLPVVESPRSASTPLQQPATTPRRAASSGAAGGRALSPPLENDSLSSDSGTDSECAADESSSEFHGSERNVANTAFQNRMSGVSRGTASQVSSARSATGTTATTVTRKKSFRKKRNSPRRAGSALPSLPSTSSSEESRCTTPRPRRPRSSRTRTTTRSTTYSGASSATPSRTTAATTRPPSSAYPLSPVSVAFSNTAASTDSDASRPTTAFGPKDRASTRTTARADSRATSTTVGGKSPTSRRGDISRATTQSSLLSKPQMDLTSSEASPSDSDTTVHTCERPGGRHQNGTAAEKQQGKNRATTPTPPDHRREKGVKNKSAFVVQRADMYAPFPPKIMRSLLPSFIDVDPFVRPDKVPQHIPVDPGRHGDEKSNTSFIKDNCHHTVHKAQAASPPKYPRPPHWEGGAQSCLLPALYSFSDESRVGDQAEPKMTRFDLGEVI